MNNTKDFKWLDVARRIQAIAQAGIEYCHNDFDLDRYTQLNDIAMEILENHSEYGREELEEIFEADSGYPTPKVDVRAVIFKENKVLMVKEKMDGRWSLPGGWADPNLTLRENLIKESEEEAGVRIKPVRLLAVLDRRLHNYPPIPHACYKIFVECELLGGEFSENTETSGSGFFSPDHLPPLSTGRNTKEQIEICFNISQNNEEPIYD